MIKMDDTTLCATILVLFLEFHPSQPGWNFPYAQKAEGNIIKKDICHFAFEKILYFSLSCMLIPVEYWENKNGYSVLS